MDDAELVEAACAGRPDAFPAIFDRHAAHVHDLALAMLRDRGAALDVVESTFLEAGLRLHGLVEAHRLPVWLLAVTRRQGALRAELASAGGWGPSFPDDDPWRARLGELLWEAVAELPMRDRTLLDLELRHGLGGRDLADALGVTPGQADTLRSRLEGLDGKFSGYLVARTSDGGCPDLAELLDGWDRRFDLHDRRHIGAHIERCPACTRALTALPPLLALYGAAMPAPPPDAARAGVLERVVVPDAPDAEQVPSAAAPAAGPEVAAPSEFQRPAPGPTRPRRRPPAAGRPGGAKASEGERAPVVVLKVLPSSAPAPPTGRASGQGRGTGAPSGAAGSGAGARIPGGATPAAAGMAAERWLANGFPPPSFPVDDAPTGPVQRGSRVRWLAAVAVIAAVLLLAAALLIANQDDDDTALRSDVTATTAVVEPTTLPEPPTLPADTVAPTAAPNPAVTVPAGPGPTAAAAAVAPGTTTGTRPATAAPAGGGELVATFDALRLPDVDSTAGTQSARMSLRNTGRGPLTYASRSSFAGLTVDRPTGTIAPGAATEVTVTLDGTRAGEGEFSGTLTFDGSGGTRQVRISAIVGRPPVFRDDAGESCTTAATPCNRVIKLERPPEDLPEPPTPCNTPWRYSITIEDESRLRAVEATANLDRRGPLRRDGSPSGPGGRWQSDVFAPLPAGARLDFTIRADDAFGFFRTTVRTIHC